MKASFVTAMLVSLLSSSTLFAHAYLDRANPAVGSEVDKPPAAVQIWFSSEIDPAGSSVQVFNTSGRQVDSNDCRRDSTDKTLLRVTLPSIPSGTYKVVWKATSADGHHTHGDFQFVVK